MIWFVIIHKIFKFIECGMIEWHLQQVDVHIKFVVFVVKIIKLINVHIFFFKQINKKLNQIVLIQIIIPDASILDMKKKK